jgi:hypothetical protein
MRRELDIHGLGSQVWTGDRLRELRPRTRRWLGVPAGLAKNCVQPFSSVNWAEGSPSMDSGSAVGWLSFRRIVDIPFDA